MQFSIGIFLTFLNCFGWLEPMPLWRCQRVNKWFFMKRLEILGVISRRRRNLHKFCRGIDFLDASLLSLHKDSFSPGLIVREEGKDRQ
jgi:hypothetical protein